MRMSRILVGAALLAALILAAMQDLADTAKKLYATLSDDQKVVAERMLGATVPPAYVGQGAGPRSGSRFGDR